MSRSIIILILSCLVLFGTYKYFSVSEHELLHSNDNLLDGRKIYQQHEFKFIPGISPREFEKKLSNDPDEAVDYYFLKNAVDMKKMKKNLTGSNEEIREKGNKIEERAYNNKDVLSHIFTTLGKILDDGSVFELNDFNQCVVFSDLSLAINNLRGFDSSNISQKKMDTVEDFLVSNKDRFIQSCMSAGEWGLLATSLDENPSENINLSNKLLNEIVFGVIQIGNDRLEQVESNLERIKAQENTDPEVIEQYNTYIDGLSEILDRFKDFEEDRKKDL